MRRSITKPFAATLGIALVALLALPAAVFANTSGPIAQTGGMTATLPMFGSQLTVAVQLDVVGNVSAVDLDPVGTYTATKVGPHAVSFETADGTSQVKIKAKGDKLSIKAKVATLASLAGSGTWSADVFGTSEPTTVGYTIGIAPDGTPTLAIDSVVAPASIVVEQGTPTTKSSDHGSSASARISFASNGFTKKLSIKVSVKAEGGAASLSITLSGKDKQKLSGTLAELVGSHAWSGHLCDGTAVGIAYDVLADGTAVFGSATGAPATAKAGEHGFSVKFDGTKTKVKVSLSEKEDGTWSLKVSAKTDKCRKTPAVDPTVNAPIAPDAQKGGGHGGDGDHDSDKASKASRSDKSHGDQSAKSNKSDRG
jgi:hypothetical protein